MKVLNFLEMFKQTMNDPDIVIDGHIETNEYLLSIFNIDSELYSQPFKPELITELFEGWQSSSVDGIPLFVKKEKYTQIEFYSKSYSLITLDEHKCTDTTRNNYPRTLDDFINDCQRAGIKLEWKTNIGTEPKE